MRRLIVAVLVMGMASPAFADIRGSVHKEGALATQQAARASAAQARPNAAGSNDDNPYFLPAVILMGAGGLVALVGITHTTGAECTGVGFSVACGTTKSKATIFTGVGMIGVGAYLYYKGKQQQKSSPQILFGPHAIGVGQQLTW